MSLRYRIKVKGKELLTKENLSRKGGILFLPNHPAHVDPILLSMHLWPKFQIRPLVVEYVYMQKGIHAILKMIHALSVPNFETSMNEVKLRKTQEVLDKIANGLKEGDNFILYPSGRLKLTGKEILGGASAAHSILQKTPETNVVLIRTVGLWGSSFSRAITGKSPDFLGTILKNLKWVLKLYFFHAKKKDRNRDPTCAGRFSSKWNSP